MADIWDQAYEALCIDVDSTLWNLRQSDVFLAMGSELERVFAAAFVVTLRLGGLQHAVDPEPEAGCGFFLAPQFKVDRYRVDFVMGWSARTTVPISLSDCIAIELDGHDWHEKTKAQAAHDKKRDRFLQTKFAAVIHFTGSEVYRDVAGCISEAAQMLPAARR